jgi:hypothetical protein
MHTCKNDDRLENILNTDLENCAQQAVSAALLLLLAGPAAASRCLQVQQQ